ncbi:MAG: single-stranded DNA-binding protein [Eubacteriales bacterium]|nr:single-stranded DNA-binding protein [Eubacteriales bacterium]
MNKFLGIGRSTKEVELRYTTGAEPLAVGRVTMAIDSGFGDKKKTNFVPITAFGKTAEFMERNLQKGKLFAVEGEYTTGSYNNKNGEKVYTTEIKADKVQVLEWGDKKESGRNDGLPEGFKALDLEDMPF